MILVSGFIALALACGAGSMDGLMVVSVDGSAAGSVDGGADASMDGGVDGSDGEDRDDGLRAGAGAAEVRVLDADAIAAYRAGDHALARARWDELLRTADLPRAERSRLYYNAGNAAARGGGWLEAVAYYTEALDGTPRDGDLWVNLEYARREAGLDPADRGDLVATLSRLVSAWTVAEARWIALGGLLLLAAGLAHEALRGGRGGRTLAWFALGSALLSCAPIARHALADDSARVFIIAERGVALRSEPRADSQVLERAEAGTYQRELDRLGDWVALGTPGGAKAWAPVTSVLSLPSAP